jgi:hypothetical protein
MRKLWGPVGLGSAALAVLCAASAQAPDAPRGPGGAGGGPAAPVPLERLIGQLGSSDYRLRQSAARAIEARGADALPALRQAASAADAEVRRRITTLVQSIERAALVAPRRVTLRLENRPVKQVVADLARASGYKLELNAGADVEKMRLSLRADNLTFWEALDRVALPAGLAFAGLDPENTLTLQRSETFDAFVSYHGAFRLAAQNIAQLKTRNLALRRNPAGAEPNGTEELTLNLVVMGEPRLPMLAVGTGRLTEAVDDRGQELTPPDEPPEERPANSTELQAGPSRIFFQTTQVSLGRPSGEARTLKRVRGTVPVLLLATQRPAATIQPILKARKRSVTAGDIELEVDEVTETPGPNYQLKLTARRKAVREEDGGWMNSLNQRLELQDAEGRKYACSVDGVTNVSAVVAEGTFTFANPGTGPLGPPVKLVVYDWRTVVYQVPFEFREVPLP